jgi:hypothetical protein
MLPGHNFLILAPYKGLSRLIDTKISGMRRLRQSVHNLPDYVNKTLHTPIPAAIIPTNRLAFPRLPLLAREGPQPILSKASLRSSTGTWSYFIVVSGDL